jgi:hypothetical protein
MLSACGGSHRVSPTAYAHDSCTTVFVWLAAVQQHSNEISQALTPGATIEARRQALLDYVGTLVRETDTALKDLDHAGIPDVDGGDQDAARLTGALEAVKTVLTNARSKLEDLPVDDAQAFGRAAAEVGASLQSGLQRVGSPIQGVTQPDLAAAFSREPACAPLIG